MQTSIRLLASAVLIVFASVQAWAQDEKIDFEKAPQKVKDAVQKKFPGAKITAASKTIENGAVVYDIEMMKDGKKHEMDVKEDGSVVNFENEIAIKDLPAAVTNAIKAKYPNCTFKEAMEVMVTKDGKDIREQYEVLIDTAEKKEVELAISPDGTKIE